MNALDTLEKRQIKELISKGWITHDAMWFAHSLNTIGIEKTNAINRAAVRSMAAFEVERLKKALGVKAATFHSFGELAAFLEGALDIVLADFMRARFSMAAGNTITWEMEKGNCFAYKGMCRMGVADKYECGVLLRIQAWLETLHIPYRMTPEVRNCLMHSNGECTGTIHIDLD